jgi:hypothetical protein
VADPIDFVGTNKTLAPPRGSESVEPLPVFNNGACSVSCWKLSKAELAEVVSSGGMVYLSVFFGRSQPPVFVGSEATVRSIVSDYGVWKR